MEAASSYAPPFARTSAPRGRISSGLQSASAWIATDPSRLVFCLALLISFCVVQIGWRNPLLDLHSFRQCQTAISTYYTLQEGFHLAYLTPVLGKPWSIPLEFPLFQWIVAAVVIVTNLPIDEAGRLVSVTFFYGTLLPAYKLLSIFLTKDRLLVLAIYLCSPVYLYWSRTFMIESTALFWSLCFLAAAGHGLIRNHYGLLALASFCGVVASAVKVTTFAVFLFAAGLLVLYLWTLRPSPWKKRTLFHYFCAAVLLFGIPVLTTQLWTEFADAKKALTPMAEGLLSFRSTEWNFGTLAQRMSSLYWSKIYGHSLPYLIGGPALLVLPLAALLMQRTHRKAILLSLLAFAAGPAIFFNLYQEHEYYWYANGIFLLFAIGLSVAALAANPVWRKPVYAIVVPVLFLVLFTAYFDKLYRWQTSRGGSFLGLAAEIQRVTPRDSILLAYGFEWSSALPYYSERRAFMDFRNRPLNDPEMKAAFQKLGDESITCLVVAGPRRGDGKFLQERIDRFQLGQTPAVRHPLADVYVRQ